MLRSGRPGRRKGDRRRLSRSTVIEVALIALASVLLYAVAIRFHAADRALAYLTVHADGFVRTLLPLPIFFFLGGLVFAWRRMAELGVLINEKLHAEDRAKRLAMTDALTGMLNRRGFEERLAELWATGEPDAGWGLMIAIDLDRFKPLNDLYGHAVGDGALIEMGHRLQALVDDGGVAARLGGDEFALYLKTEPSLEEAENALAHVRESLNRAMVIDGFVCRVGATLGAAIVGRDGEDVETLLRRADLALYDGKRRHRGTVTLYRQSMEDLTLAKAELEMALRAAVEADELEPHYLALADLKSGRVVGYEMLARWRHPTRGDVTPAEFIPIAEDAGIITQLMTRLLRRACTEVKSWDGSPTLSVNLSPVQFQDPWLASRILQILTETGFPAERLEVELTEAVLTNDIGMAREVVAGLKDKGVRIVLDNFGTGYSSLKYLRELPFDRLKIDRSFVNSYRDDPNSRSIVAAIFVLARGLDIGVTAEGIEDLESESILKDLGCDFGQGFLYGRPRRHPAQPQLPFEPEADRPSVKEA